jgi:dephospho-CoA kinase
MTPRLRIGLTGGIGAGKSTVAMLFEALGVPVIDADVIARQVVQPGQPALQELVDCFGVEILREGGGLDRQRLRERIFDEPAGRKRAEAILHPRIREVMETRIAELDSPYCVLSIPLLLEANQTDLVNRILVVDASPELQLSRARARDGASTQQIRAIMDAQLDQAARLQAAADVIRTESDLGGLGEAVRRLHAHYLGLAERDLPASNK